MRIAPPRRRLRASLVALTAALAVIAPSLVVGAAPPSAAATLVPTEAAAPTVTVTPSAGLQPGDVVTVTGTGFSPVPPATSATRAPLAGQFGGVYVVFGAFAPTWKPSEGAPSSTRVAAPGQTRWVVNPENVATIGGAARGGVAINPDGSFTVQLTVTDEYTGMLANGTLGVYTYAGGGVVYAPFETETPLSFAPRVTVSSTTNLTSGDVITVEGRHFSPAPPATNGTRFPLPGAFGGVYVVFGSYAETWKPSQGARSASRVAAPGQTKWVVNPENLATIGGEAAGGVAINPDGSFSVQLTVTDTFTGMLADGRLGVYTFPGSGAVYAPFETETLISFAAAEPEPTPEPSPEVTPPPAPQPTTAGSLRWGVKESFRSYVTGTVAQGSIRVAGAGNEGSTVIFPQSAPGGAAGAAYGGSVRFLGHNGLMDVTIASPEVRILSEARGELVATVNGSRVVLATLALDRGTRSVLPDGAVRYLSVPATLTAAGSPTFGFGGSVFYTAGTALDAVTFTIGAPSSASTPSRVVGAFAGRSIPSEPPARTGATLVGLDPAAVQPGQVVTVSAAGFQPFETSIVVVVYSEPIVLSESATADADGVVTWTGTLPADLIGVHTLTLQGSIVHGVEVTIRQLAASVSIAGACALQDAELVWGFKESFRAYVSGSIANGEWQALDGATYETPNFLFTGEGALEPASGEGEVVFTGAMRFVGHAGILDTTLANPRLVMLDSDTAQLVLDVTGTTQAGEAISAEGVVFADVDLSAATRTAELGELVIADAPVTLTATGAEAFGTYPAGEALDPITVTATLADDCGTAAVAETGAAASAASGTEVPGWVWAVLVALLIVIVALAALLIVMRRRASAA